MVEYRNWREYAACVNADPETFFPVGEVGTPGYDAQVSAALGYCRVCPVRAACLEFAVATEQTHGVFGGTAPEERRGMLRDSEFVRSGGTATGGRRTSIPDYGEGYVERYGRMPGRGVRGNAARTERRRAAREERERAAREWDAEFGAVER